MKKYIKLAMALGLVGAVTAHAAIDYGAAGAVGNPLTTNVVLDAGDSWQQATDITIQGGSVDASITDLYRFRVGVGNTTKLTIDGGSFDWQGTGQDVIIGNGSGSSGIIDLLSGSLNIDNTGKNLHIGRDNATGILRIQGGSVTLAVKPLFEDPAKPAGQGSIDFTTAYSGTLTVAGADKAYYVGMYGDDDLSFGGVLASGATAKTFDEQFSVTGETITAIPEPATLGLVAAFGGAVLFIRRRFMI